jgi:hypothetical protein
MGKLVQFQRGIATVIPSCANMADSQTASLGDVQHACELQALKPDT